MAYTIDTIKAHNARAGLHFFEPDTLRFFRSRILGGVWEGPGGVYFVTSERFVASDGTSPGRFFTVRRYDPASGDVRTARGEVFNGTRWRSTAQRRAARYAREGEPGERPEARALAERVVRGEVA